MGKREQPRETTGGSGGFNAAGPQLDIEVDDSRSHIQLTPDCPSEKVAIGFADRFSGVGDGSATESAAINRLDVRIESASGPFVYRLTHFIPPVGDSFHGFILNQDISAEDATQFFNLVFQDDEGLGVPRIIIFFFKWMTFAFFSVRGASSRPLQSQHHQKGCRTFHRCPR
uniref:Uncharacterized protein n=1 Tax=Chromera velia CCMP2878 TaxID=1169474 RepID=A0A0G4HZT9_9ALVE|eukprot:Cvel_9802.t1-p1 / transcript=Cvel_9802.t1 / gene=Cvel_9802 / organism=Chromera_velia_CCMP2878 / gene_product=hypothetical protein / transcript_product=hypothetical protein / location=Cvel_scaffold575:33450-33959(+) / protein_length=170 / sequence_SO=supercontig / SO=protein_coding / is_pseudo=false